MDEIMRTAARHGLAVVEDTAQALGAKCGTRYAGTFGDFGCFSFYKTKNLSTFEGGIIAVRDADRAERVRRLVNPQANKAAGFPEIGFNFRMPEPCALIGYEKLKLHWDQALVELGRVNERDGFYPYVAYQLPPFRKHAQHCPVAEAVALEVASRCMS